MKIVEAFAMNKKKTPSALRLLLVDDHAVMRAGLANMLNSRPEFEVIAGADDGESAIKLYLELSPDVTVLDVMMPGMGGIECLRQLKELAPTAKVLILSSSDLERDMQQAMELGADGYIHKTALPAELIASVLAVGRGETCFSNEVSRCLADFPHSKQLTPREFEVLQLLRKGMSNSDIGLNLGIKPRTAKAHVAAILIKLEAHDRTEAVAKGFERGLLRL